MEAHRSWRGRVRPAGMKAREGFPGFSWVWGQVVSVQLRICDFYTPPQHTHNSPVWVEPAQSPGTYTHVARLKLGARRLSRVCPKALRLSQGTGNAASMVPIRRRQESNRKQSLPSAHTLARWPHPHKMGQTQTHLRLPTRPPAPGNS